MSPAPKFSVIIPTYNRAGYLAGALESVKAQEFRDFEVIVVDDGSTDNTQEVLRSYGSWIKVLHQPNGGPGKARNLGVAHACGDYVAFLDSDDQWFPWTLGAFAEVTELAGRPELIASNRHLFVHEVELLKITRQPLKLDIFDDYLESSAHGYIVGSCILVAKRAAFLRSGGFSERRIYAEDSDLSLRFGLSKGFVQILSPVTLGYRLHVDNAFRNRELVLKGTHNILEQERAGHYPGGPARKPDRARLITLHVRPLSLDSLRQGDQARAWQLYFATFGWHLRQHRWKFLLVFPVFALLSLVGLWRAADA